MGSPGEVLAKGGRGYGPGRVLRPDGINRPKFVLLHLFNHLEGRPHTPTNSPPSRLEVGVAFRFCLRNRCGADELDRSLMPPNSHSADYERFMVINDIERTITLHLWASIWFSQVTRTKVAKSRGRDASPTQSCRLNAHRRGIGMPRADRRESNLRNRRRAPSTMNFPMRYAGPAPAEPTRLASEVWEATM